VCHLFDEGLARAGVFEPGGPPRSGELDGRELRGEDVREDAAEEAVSNVQEAV
jgi:hypothetical protein